MNFPHPTATQILDEPVPSPYAKAVWLFSNQGNPHRNVACLPPYTWNTRFTCSFLHREADI